MERRPFCVQLFRQCAGCRSPQQRLGGFGRCPRQVREPQRHGERLVRERGGTDDAAHDAESLGLSRREAILEKEDAKRFVDRVNEISVRSKVLDPIGQATETKLDASLNAMEAAIRSGAAAGQSARARAYGQALRRGQATPVDDDSDYWRRLAAATAVLYLQDPPPDALKEALAQAQKLSADDEKMARPHFVAARLHLALGDEAAAIAALDKAIKIAPKFTAAADSRKLLDLK